MIQVEKHSPEEEKVINELKIRTQHKLPSRLRDDETLFYRFLKARDFNLNNAESMLCSNIEYWKKYKVEELLQSYSPPQHLSTYLASSFIGFDKDGCLIRYMDFGAMDAKGMTTMFTVNEIIEYILEYCEKDIDRMTAQTKKLRKPVTKLLFIVNMDKLNFFDVTYKKGIEILQEFLNVYQIMHPERVKSTYVINASTTFYIMFTLLKSFVSSELLRKTSIYGRNDWKEALLAVIDADVLPAFLGGNRTDPDGNPLCNTFVVHGKIIPKEMYTKNKKSLSQEIGVKKLTVSRFSSKAVDICVNQPETQIEWEFETKKNDIAFYLQYRSAQDEESHPRVLIPKQRLDTATASETGIFKCEEAGIYSIVFDNSYSWFYSKEIYYRIRCIQP